VLLREEIAVLGHAAASTTFRSVSMPIGPAPQGGAVPRRGNAHVLPRLGHYRLAELTPEVVSRFGAELQRAGVGANTRHKALTFLSGVLRTAVEWGRLPTNPVRTCASRPCVGSASRSRRSAVSLTR